MTDIPHKRGDTFLARCTFANDAGEPVALPTNVQIASSVKSLGGQTRPLVVTKAADQTANPGRFDVAASAAGTAAWPVGPLAWDIQYTRGDEVFSTDTFRILPVEDVTP